MIPETGPELTASQAIAASATASPADRLIMLGVQLPPAPPPVANFVTHVREGDLLYLSGQGPREADGRLWTGKVGEGVSVSQAYQHARLVGINLLAVMQEALGDLSRVKRVVKLLGMVNASPDFEDHPQVINGCSDLFIDVFGEAGHHARSAVGFGSLPGNITVEIEAIVALRS
ncbi:endoribonuclease L-PSP (plasmid) [Aminobacter sp. Y103A]|nr:endoribonuclease L-PSP [Aminobacter sp. SS-2016]